MTSAAQKLPYGVDAQNKAQFTVWVAERGLRRSERGACLHWIARGGCHVAFCRETRSEHRWMDHVSGWTKDGKPALLLCQPYHLDDEDLRDLTRTADRFGLMIAVHGAGWYGNGTVAIELTRRAQGGPIELCAVSQDRGHHELMGFASKMYIVARRPCPRAPLDHHRITEDF